MLTITKINELCKNLNVESLNRDRHDTVTSRLSQAKLLTSYYAVPSYSDY